MKKALCKCYFVNEYTGGISSERFPVLVHLESGVPNFQSDSGKKQVWSPGKRK